MFSFIQTPKNLVVHFDGKTKTVSADANNFNSAMETVKNITGSIAVWGENHQKTKDLITQLEGLLDVRRAISAATAGVVRIAAGVDGKLTVMFNDRPVHNYAATRILEMFHAGFAVTPMLKFMEKTFMNPQADVQEDLYRWLESAEMPITVDGDFLAYKKVNADYTSIHDNETDNSIGKVVEEDPNVVDWNRNQTCSRGLHFCSTEYLPQFGSGGGNRVVIVKVNPAHVCAIPTDYNLSKGRAYKYTVIGEVPEAQAAEYLRGQHVVDHFQEYDDRDDVEEEDYNDYVPDDDVSDCSDDVDPMSLTLDELDEILDSEDTLDPIVEEKPQAYHVYRGYSREYILGSVSQFGKRGAAKQLKMGYSTLWDWLSKYGKD